MSITPKTDVSWRNYSKPTPKNLLRFSVFIQDVLIGLTTLSAFMEMNKWVPIVLGGSIIVVRQGVKFFADVVADSTTESATAELPSGKEITVTVPKDKPETETN